MLFLCILLQNSFNVALMSAKSNLSSNTYHQDKDGKVLSHGKYTESELPPKKGQSP